MAIEFIIEDGTAKTDATSYASEAQFLQYWENRGTDYSTQSSDVVKAWLNSATEYIDNNYNFKGTITDENQALEFPRYGAYDCYGYGIEDDEIPQALIDATCYIAAKASKELDAVGSNVSSIRYGPVSKSYSGNSSSARYKVADKLLKCLIIQGATLVRVN